jgi:hypothetical protein
VVASISEIDHLITDGTEDITSAFAAAGADLVSV